MTGVEIHPQQSGVRYIEIDDVSVGQRIDNFLIRLLKGVPRSHIYRILRSGEVRINKGRIKPIYRIKKGDRVRIPPLRLPPLRDAVPKAPAGLLARLEAAIILEDDDFMFLNKPAGLAVHGGSGIDWGVIELLRQARPKLPMLELGHRLDRDTSGCLLIAKSRQALIGLHHLLREGKVDKRYLALVAGCWQGGERTVAASLFKRQSDAPSKGKVVVGEAGKRAQTSFIPLQNYRNDSLLQVRIHTGRTHQIRVHAAHIGYPLAGDDKYGDSGYNRQMKGLGLKRLFLHASLMAFQIPGQRKGYRVEAPLEPSLRQVLSKLEAA